MITPAPSLGQGNLNNAMSLYNQFQGMGQPNSADQSGSWLSSLLSSLAPQTPNSANIVPKAPSWNGSGAWFNSNPLISRQGNTQPAQQKSGGGGGGGILGALGGCF